MKKYFLFLLIALLYVSCKDSTTVNTNPAVKITMNTAKAVMMINEARVFSATVDSSVTNKTLTWSVDPSATGGTVTADATHNNFAVYTAPANEGVYKLFATLDSDPTQKAYIEITVQTNEINDTIIFFNGNIGAVENNPTNPTVFTIDRERKITYLHTYHYFNGGHLPGTIGLKHQDGTVYGPWQSVGGVGQGGVQNANWYCYIEPYTIKAGTYTVVDSDPGTWSHNAESNYCGFTTVRAMK